MYNYWRHHQSLIKEQDIPYGRIAIHMLAAIIFMLATGGWTAPVAVIAAPAMPTNGATFNITWSTDCETPPAEAVTALDYAAGLWGTWISSTVPISVTVCWTNALGIGDALGTGAPAKYATNFSNAPLMNTAYPVALANALSGSDLYPALGDMTLQFKSDQDWSYVTTTTHLAAPAAGEDFVSVALHELAHGLGFVGNMYEDSGVGFCGGYLYPCPTPYDWFAMDSTGVRLLDSPTPLVLGALLKSDANFGGPNAVAANGGMTAKLYTPATFYLGTSLSHLDQTTYQYSENDLMTPIYDGGAIRHPGPVTLGIFQDMGWLRADGVPNVITSGPSIMGAGQEITLTGDLIWASYAGQPITYTWTAADQITATHPSLTATDNITFTWDTPGEKRITLTATDGVTSAHATRALLVYNVAASGATQGDTNQAYTFNAAISPEILNLPITYTWEATDKAPIVHANLYQTTDSAALTWTMPGTKTITITAAIAGAATQSTHLIDVEGLVLDKFIFLPLVLRQ